MIEFFGRKFVFLFWGGFVRAGYTLRQISPFLTKNTSIIDVGSGLGHVSFLLGKSGWKMTSVDIKDTSKFNVANTVLYDGEKIPFDTGSFDYSLLLTVLHHDKNPQKLLKEALRVSNRVLIIEDIYKSFLEKYTLRFIDNLLNWDWFNNPHSNKKDTEWREFFKNHNIKVIAVDYWFTLIGGFYPIRQVLYLIEKGD